MVKVSSRGRMASPSRDPDTEEDPNEWMDSAIPVDEVLGNTLTSQGFRIEDRPRSPSVPRSPNSVPASPATSPTGKVASGGGPRLEVGLGKGLEAGGPEGSEYRVSRFSDVSLSDVGGDRELRSEPSLVEMVVRDTEGGIPVEPTGIGTENGTKQADLLQQGLGEVQGPALSVPTTVPEDRPLVETSENRGRLPDSLTTNGQVEAQRSGEEKVGSTDSEPASTSGRGAASESGQYKTKRPPAIAVSHPTPLPEPQVRPGPAEDETRQEDRKELVLGHSSKPSGGSSEVANGSQKVGVGGKSDIREDDIASDGSEAFATQAEQTPSTAASVRPSVHHARVNSVDSAYR